VELDVFDYLSFVVLGILLTVFVTFVVVAGSLPGKIAQRRNHPQAKAISAAAWISLLTLGALWPIAFVWAFTNPNTSQNSEKKETRS
jgi:fatty acid desaturase